MDLKINSTNFSGKKEILYGLNKASDLAQLIEYDRTAYKGRKIKDQMVVYASMRAYLDMATKDDLFCKAVKNFTQKELQPIKDNLKEFTTQHGTIKPFGVFKDALETVIKKDRNGAPTKRTASNELLELLA